MEKAKNMGRFWVWVKASERRVGFVRVGDSDIDGDEKQEEWCRKR